MPQSPRLFQSMDGESIIVVIVMCMKTTCCFFFYLITGLLIDGSSETGLFFNRVITPEVSVYTQNLNDVFTLLILVPTLTDLTTALRNRLGASSS